MRALTCNRQILQGEREALHLERNALRQEAETTTKAMADLEQERSTLAEKLKRSMVVAGQSEVAKPLLGREEEASPRQAGRGAYTVPLITL